jgi:hypothetical protein
MKQARRKLAVKKETLQRLALDDASLARVGGGSALCGNRTADADTDWCASGTGASLSGSVKC